MNKNNSNEKVKNFLWISAIFLLALFLRLVYLYQFRQNPFFESPVIDALSHYLFAKRISAGDWLLRGVVAPRVPLYVYFLAVLFKILGSGFMAARVVQAVLGAFNCVLVYFLGKKVFSRNVGIIAAFICSIYGVFIYFDAQFLNVTLALFFNIGMLLALLHTVDNPNIFKWLGCGTLFGIALQVSANVILFFPLMLFWIYLYDKKASVGFKAVKNKRLIPLLSIVIAVVLMLMPFAIRNYLQGEDFVLLSSTGGINLYIGNNPYADGKTAAPPSRDYSYRGWKDNVWVSSIKTAERIEGRKMKPSEVSDFWTFKALRFVVENPGKWFNLLTRKFYYFFNAYEIPENQSIYFFRMWSSLLRILVFSGKFISFPFGIICPLALLGIAVSFKKEKEVMLLDFFILSQFLLMIIFFVVSRYRVAVVPYFIIFASFALIWLINKFKQREYKTLTLSLILLFVMFAFVNTRFFDAAADNKSRWLFNLGTAFRYKGQTQKALKSFIMAQQVDPNNLDAVYNLGVLYLEAGQYEKAIAKFEETIISDPDDSAAYSNIGFSLARQNKLDEALAYYEKALAIDPEDAGTMVNIGAAYIQKLQFIKALKVLQQAKIISRDFAPVHNHLGVVYEKLERYKHSEAEYRMAIKLDPEYLECYYNLAGFYERRGESEKSKAMRSKVMEILSKIDKH
ncbi:MAG: tetratricopeptide repeat protein [Candidatus Omnitrophica bacterium]|nr:tetratricopeptide repeat protein [Candidatus Omnitrophota bacterium]